MANTALLIIDVQQGFNHPTHWGSSRSNPAFEKNLEKLLEHFRAAKPTPLIIHVQHHSLLETSPLHPSSAGLAFQPYSAPQEGETVITKNENSAFIGTNLESFLREHKITKLFACGLTTDQCVSTTVRMAANLHVCDFEGAKGEVVLVGDATAAYGYQEISGEMIHKVHEATLRQEFCRVVSTEDAIKEIAGSS